MRQVFCSTQQPGPQCQGPGRIIPERCTPCAGEGRIKKNKTLEVKIPAGINEGMRIRSSGNGEPGTNGGPAGGLFIENRLKQHENFERDGDDPHCTAPGGPASAALAGGIAGPPPGGKAPSESPESTQHRTTFPP